MELDRAHSIYRFYDQCHAEAEELHIVVRRGSDAIFKAITAIGELPQSRDELFRDAIDSTRRDGTASSAGNKLTELNDSMRELLNTAVSLANWDEPPKTYTLEWNAAKARQNHAMEQVWPLCPPKITDTVAVISGKSKPLRSKLSKSDEVPLRSWTQKDLDLAIEKYKAERSELYHRLVQETSKKTRVAIVEAQKVFGRNAIARALGLKAKAMVSNSPAYQTIAGALGLAKGKRHGPAVGLDIGIESHGLEVGDTTEATVIRRETISLVKKSRLGKKESEAIIDQLERGERSDDQARELLKFMVCNQ